MSAGQSPLLRFHNELNSGCDHSSFEEDSSRSAGQAVLGSRRKRDTHSIESRIALLSMQSARHAIFVVLIFVHVESGDLEAQQSTIPAQAGDLGFAETGSQVSLVSHVEHDLFEMPREVCASRQHP